VGKEFGLVNMYCERLLQGVVRDGDGSVAVLEEVFENGEVSLVVDLAPSLVLGVVMLECLQTIDANAEICGVENCVV
jgi:hypothetical protein